MKATIRSYDARVDSDAAFELWGRSIGRSWPVEHEDFDAIVHEGFVALLDDQIAGVVAFARLDSVASLKLLLVDAGVRRRGVGSRLIETTLAALAAGGVTEVRLASTPGPYFWPGLPPDLTDARSFFERYGWKFGDPCWDLVRSLTDYQTPDDVERPVGITFRWAAGDDREQLLDFERTNFPSWYSDFASDRTLVRSIVAVDESGKIVGSLLAEDARHPPLWRNLLGADSGSIGAVGVEERMRERRIGTALVAYACEQLRDRGVVNCHIGWTPFLSFYGRLGFQPWRRFEMATRSMPRSS
jgi:GNAT superfamily N-acetyltransferase